MNSPDVAAALSTGAPDAAGKLYDAHAEALFQFCWLTLRDRQQARTAVCDALAQAGARVAELSDPATLRAWLFALVRAECHRHPLPSLGDTDEPIARPEQRDAALRIMAWNSVMSLDRVQRQALDLATRHGMTEAEIALILGLPLAGTTELLATTRTELEQALGAEILVSRDRLECPGRTGAIHGWTGTVTPEFRARVLDHAGSCEVCRPKLPRNVSAGRIFGLLPAPALDREARVWVIGRVGDLVLSQAAEADPAPAAPLPPDPLGGRPDPLAARVDSAPADRVDPARAEPVIPDPVVPHPVVPDPAVAEPVLPGPAASPHIVSEDREPAVPAGPAEPAEPAVPVERATPGPRATVTPNPRAAAAPRPKTPPSDRTAATPGPGQRRRRFGPRVFAGLGAAVAAAAVAAGLTLGGAGGSHARLSGSDSQLVPSSVEQSQTGAAQPDPRPDAPPSTPGHGSRQHGTAATTTPAVGGADAVASGKQAGMDAAGAGRAGDQSGQTRRTVTVAPAPSTQAARPGGQATTQTAARLTVSPASLNLGPGSSGALSLTVSGGSMSWSAAASSSSVSLSPASGYLGSNGSASVDVTVQRAGNSGGSASVSIDGAVVSVSWAATTPASPAPSVSSGSSGSSGASGSAGSSPASGSAGSSPPPVRRRRQPHPGGSPGPAGS